MSNYTEPGVSLNLVEPKAEISVQNPELIPLIIGTAFTKIKETVTMARGTGTEDIIPSEVDLDNIYSVGFRPSQSNFTAGASSDYSTSEVEGVKKITWTATGKNKIIENSTYYITYYKTVDYSNAEAVLMNSTSQIANNFGDYAKVEDDGAITLNPLALGCYFALSNGASKIYALPVTDATSAAYTKALEQEAMFLDNVWRIVPMDMPTDGETEAFKTIHQAIDQHISICSRYDEKKERTAIYGFDTISEIDNSFYENYKNYAKSKSSSRVTVIYPNSAEAEIPGINKVVTVGPQYLAAAYAGLEANIPGYIPKTRYTISGFKTLNNVKLLRQKLNDIASAGIMILTQSKGSGTDVVIRHQLTTDMSEVATRENSVVYIKDYVTKKLRLTCEKYVGKTNINSDLITRVKGSLNAEIAGMISEGFILSGTINDVIQNADKPDTILVDARVYVPYPCNYIDITLYVE